MDVAVLTCSFLQVPDRCGAAEVSPTSWLPTCAIIAVRLLKFPTGPMALFLALIW